MVLKIVGLDHRQKSMPETLSGGEQQRVAIARAIVTKPGILLADEPTGNLDFKTSEEIMELFTQINQMGTSILMATHDLDIVAGTGRKIVMLESWAENRRKFWLVLTEKLNRFFQEIQVVIQLLPLVALFLCSALVLYLYLGSLFTREHKRLELGFLTLRFFWNDLPLKMKLIKPFSRLKV